MAYIKFLIITTMVITIPENTVQQCSIQTRQNYMYANCSNKKFQQIPENLNQNIQILDLSYNTISSVKKQTMKKYPKIFQFIMHVPDHEARACKIDKDAFLMKDLEILDLENNQIDKKLLFPQKIRTLKLSGTGQTSYTLDISYLKNLMYLFLARNSLDAIPDIHKLAPLNLLDLRQNPLKLIKPDILANYCHLKYLHFEADNNSLQLNDYCSKKVLLDWITKTEILGFRSQKGFVNESACSNATFSEEMQKNYKECLDYKKEHPERFANIPIEIPTHKYTSLWQLISFYAVIVIPIVLFISTVFIIFVLKLIGRNDLIFEPTVMRNNE